jgi:carboxyl-terminal processing protease
VQRGLESEKRKGLGFVSGLLIGIFLSASVVILGFLAGKYLHSDDKSSTLESGNSIVVNGIVDKDDIISSEFIKKVNTIEMLIEELYYLEEVDDETMREGAYEGIVAALGDPYSVYYTPEEAEEIFAQTEGIYYGIGAYVQLDTVTGYGMITGTIKGTPAEEAGLRSGDIIYKVEDEDMAGLDLTQVVSRIKGEEGTKVHITLIREGQELEVDVERRKIESPTVESSMLDDKMGYVQIAEFDDVTVHQFSEALEMLKENNAEGMILDLRANPGGSLYAVVDIADMLLGEGLVVYTEDKKGNREVFDSDANMLIDIPIVILVDGNSASASEVLSGALKDHGKATLVGTTTFGKGIVQTIRTMRDGSAIKLTISAYYTPSGTNIHGTGIEPDVVVEFDGEAYYGEGFDNQLEKAKEVLSEIIK